MVIDATAIILLFIFAAFGAFSGAILQVAGVLAAIAAYVFARPVAVLIHPMVEELLSSTNFAVVSGASLLIAGLGIFIVLRILIQLIGSTITGFSDAINTLDRIGGLVIGFIKGAILVFLCAQGLFLILERSPSVNDAVGSAADESLLMDVTSQVDLAELVDDVRGSPLLMQNGAEPEPEPIEESAPEDDPASGSQVDPVIEP